MLTGSSPVVIYIDVNSLNRLIILHIRIGKKEKDDSQSTNEQMLITTEWFLEIIIKVWTLYSTRQNFLKNSLNFSLLKCHLPTKNQPSFFSASPTWLSWFFCLHSLSPPEPHPPSGFAFALGDSSSSLPSTAPVLYCQRLSWRSPEVEQERGDASQQIGQSRARILFVLILRDKVGGGVLYWSKSYSLQVSFSTLTVYIN